MMEQGKKHLSDILQSIELIEQFTVTSSNFDEFSKDLKTQSAVELQLWIIGEAVNKYNKLLSEGLLEHSGKIVEFRNRLIHAYDAVDSSIVWAIIKNHLHPLNDEVINKLK
ncbi:MAG: HepT-like ribonuclease domain-containing protein [Bacteroidota bacterium]